MRKVLKIMLVAFFANFAISAVADETGNLVSNHGFEEWKVYTKKVNDPKKFPALKDKMVPTDWEVNQETVKGSTESTGSVTKDDTVKRSGKSSVKIENKKPVNTTAIVRWNINVKPDTMYKITIWTKGKNVKKGKGGVGSALWASTGPKKGFWSDKKGGHKFLNKNGDYDWTPMKIIFTTRPEDEQMIINAQLRWSSGTIWFDDIEVTEVK